MGLETWCGVAIIDLAKGEGVEWIRLEGKIIQLFVVVTLPDVSCPKLIGAHSDEIANLVSIEVSALPKTPARQDPRRPR